MFPADCADQKAKYINYLRLSAQSAGNKKPNESFLDSFSRLTFHD
jgi:hypothetical protein